jgi:hypothetical protein
MFHVLRSLRDFALDALISFNFYNQILEDFDVVQGLIPFLCLFLQSGTMMTLLSHMISYSATPRQMRFYPLRMEYTMLKVISYLRGKAEGIARMYAAKGRWLLIH